MSVRLSTAVLLAGFAFATPVYAEGDPLAPEIFLDTYGTDTAVLIAADLIAVSPLGVEVDLLDPKNFLDPRPSETAALIANDLAAAASVSADIDLLNPDRFLDSQEAEETAALIAFDLAMQRSLALSQPGLDQPTPVVEILDSELIDLRPESLTPVEWVNLTPSDEQIEFVSLAPEHFLDSDADDTLAWIAADLASAGELTTGSIEGGSTGSIALPVEQPVAISLTDDALSFQEYLIP